MSPAASLISAPISATIQYGNDGRRTHREHFRRLGCRSRDAEMAEEELINSNTKFEARKCERSQRGRATGHPGLASDDASAGAHAAEQNTTITSRLSSIRCLPARGEGRA